MPHPSAIKVFSPTFTGITLAVSPPTTKNVVGGLKVMPKNDGAYLDANRLLDTGIYFINGYFGTMKNYPATATNKFALLFVFNYGNKILDVLINLNTKEINSRNKNNDIWDAWK